jgi:ribosome biogenesis GTPase A
MSKIPTECKINELVSDSYHEQDKIILSSFSCLQDDIKALPNCAEKSLLELIYLLKNEEKYSSDDVQESSHIKEFQNLQIALKKEGLNTVTNLNYINSIEISLRYSDNRGAIVTLNKLLENIRDVNIQEIVRLISENNKALEIIKDKNVYLLIGLTGAGKSTTIHFLAGSKMESTPLNGQPHISPTEIRNRYLSKVKTSPFFVSETRQIFPVVIELDKNERFGRDSIIMCDTPGILKYLFT